MLYIVFSTAKNFTSKGQTERDLQCVLPPSIIFTNLMHISVLLLYSLMRAHPRGAQVNAALMAGSER